MLPLSRLAFGDRISFTVSPDQRTHKVLSDESVHSPETGPLRWWQQVSHSGKAIMLYTQPYSIVTNPVRTRINGSRCLSSYRQSCRLYHNSSGARVLQANQGTGYHSFWLPHFITHQSPSRVFQERVDSQVLCTWAKETNSGGCYPMVPFGQAMFPQKFIFLIDIKVPHRLVKASLMALMYI